MAHVTAIHYDRQIALLDDGQVLPITNWYDGKEDCDPEDATGCVAGPDVDGEWYAVDISKFVPKKPH